MAGKITQIEQKLLGLDAANFQRLCADYLTRKEPKLKHCIAEYGGVKGRDKTKKGIPDIYFRLTNGHYVFVECTTKEERTFEKLKKDLNSCFQTKTPIEEIDRIYLCYIGNAISTEEDRILHKLAKEKGIPLEIIGIDQLKYDIRREFPVLGKDYLSIPIDSGQILDENTFLSEQQDNKFGTGLEQALIGRDSEVASLLEKLKIEDVLLIVGKPGVGKTRLSVEVCKRWCNLNEGYHMQFITPKKGTLREELYEHFPIGTPFIILVDDANRLEDIDSVLWFCQNKSHQIKLLLTIRDFAIKKIENVFSELEKRIPKKIEVNRLSDDIIKSILIEMGVRHSTCHYKITRLVNGNPRLAIMAGDVALKNGFCDALNDISEVYDLYYEPYFKNSQKLLEQDDLKILGILSAFKVIDYNDKDFFKLVFDAFGYNKNQLLDGFYRLDEGFELVDFDENQPPEMAKIADQTLASYVFYQVFIIKKLLSFQDLIKFFFSNYKGRIRDALNPILSSYGFDNVAKSLKPLIDNTRGVLSTESIELRFDFFEEFVSFQEEETIDFLLNILESVFPVQYCESDFQIQKNNFNKTNKFISVAKKLYRRTSYFLYIIDLILDYLGKIPSLFDEVVKYCEKELYIHTDDCENGYIIQLYLFESLFKRADSHNEISYIYYRLIIAISPQYLRIIADGIHERKKYEPSNYINWVIADDSQIILLRKNLWEYIFRHFSEDKERVSNIIESSQSHRAAIKNGKSKLLETEAHYVVFLLNKHLSPEIFSDCCLAHNYLQFLEKCNVSTKPYALFRRRFMTLTYRHYAILSLKYSDYYKKRKHFQRLEIEEFYHKYFLEKFRHYLRNDYQRLMQSYYEIIETRFISWEINRHMSIIISQLAKHSSVLFFEVISDIFYSGNPSGFTDNSIINRLLEKFHNRENELWEWIDSFDFINKEYWKLSYLLNIPENKIDKTQYYRLLACIEKIPSWSLHSPKELEKYELVNKNIFPDVMALIYRRIKDENFKFETFGFIEKFGHKFNDKYNLLKKLYFYFQKHERGHDYDAKDFRVIYEKNKEFIFDYLVECYPEDEFQQKDNQDEIKDLSFIWKENNYEEIIEKILNFFALKTRYIFSPAPFLKALFYPNIQNIDKEKAVILLKYIIKNNPKKTQLLRLIFEIISEGFSNELLSFFHLYISIDSSYNTFIKLPHRPSSIISSNDSYIPRLHREIEFWQELLKIIPPKLEFREHRRYIDRNIEYLQKEIQREKKQKFWLDY